LQERVWINGYHSKVMSKIGPLVDSKTRDWLSFSTRELEI
jgi:hypothetical protein